MTGQVGDQRVTAAHVSELCRLTECDRDSAKRALQTQALLIEMTELQANGSLEEKVDFLLAHLKGSVASRHHRADNWIMDAARKVLEEPASPTLGKP